MSDVITLANQIVQEKERIRKAIEDRGVNIPASTPLSDYRNKILSIDTSVTPSDIYYRDDEFDDTVTTFTVPAKYETLMENSLSNYTNLQTLNLNYVKYIFDNTCIGDSALTSVTGNYLKYIGENAFMKTALTSFSNDSVEYIGDNAFKGTPIESVTLDKCKIIGNNAFYKCDELVDIDLGDTEIIKNNAFYDCKLLKTIVSDKAKEIGDFAFYNMDSEDYAYDETKFTLSFPKVERIGAQTFQQIKGLTAINLPKCKSIGYRSFNYCQNLETFTAPELEKLGYYAFNDTNKIYTLYLPNCMNIGDHNFYDNSHALTELTIADGCRIDDYCFHYGIGTLNGKPSYIGNYCFNYLGYYNNTKEIEIDLSDVTHIGYNSFKQQNDWKFKNETVDLKNCQSIGASGVTDSSFTHYSSMLARKIWIPSTCIIYYNYSGNLIGFNDSSCHIYTDAATKPSGWSQICNSATWHFGATHEEFEAA